MNQNILDKAEENKMTKHSFSSKKGSHVRRSITNDDGDSTVKVTKGKEDKFFDHFYQMLKSHFKLEVNNGTMKYFYYSSSGMMKYGSNITDNSDTSETT
jgi:hypothetical protein